MPQLEGTAVAMRSSGFPYHISENFRQRKFQTVKSYADRKPGSGRSPSKAEASLGPQQLCLV